MEDNPYIRKKILNLNLDLLEKEVRSISDYEIKKNIHKLSSTEIDWHGSLTSMLDPYYNVFHHDTYPEILNYLDQLRIFFKENYEIKTDLFIHSWINLTSKNNHLQWHNHSSPSWPPFVKAYHGYIAVYAEPSITTYAITNGDETVIEEVINKNNQLIIGKSTCDRHIVSAWTEDRERITIAFDILETSLLNEYNYRVFSPFLLKDGSIPKK